MTKHNQQRYIQQIGYVDRELERLLDRLRRFDLFDKAMIVVTADHGFAWEVGVATRRRVRQGNVDELAPVPLFIKAPGQRKGRVSRAYVRTLDIVPTMADLLDIRLPYRADGRSAFSRAVSTRRVVRLPTRDFSHVVRIGARSYERRRRAILRRRIQRFGFGDRGLYTGIGPHRKLLGEKLSDLRVRSHGRVRAKIRHASALRSVQRDSHVLPNDVVGDLRGGRTGGKHEVAVAVNGRIEAVGRTFYLQGDQVEHFALNVPPEVLREGSNEVEILQVSRIRRTLRLLGRL